MKKLFTLCLGLVATLAAQAQSDFPVQFADKDGNIIADGTTLNLNEYKADDFGEVQVPANLFVKNTTNEDVQVGGAFAITTLSSGDFQTCFPENCIRKTSKVNYETESGKLAAGALKDMQTEWFPAEEGSAVVVYQLLAYKENPVTHKWTIDQYGPTVTLNFTYSTTSLKPLQKEGRLDGAWFDLQGRNLQGEPTQKGVYIVNGRKAIVK